MVERPIRATANSAAACKRQGPRRRITTVLNRPFLGLDQRIVIIIANGADTGPYEKSMRHISRFCAGPCGIAGSADRLDTAPIQRSWSLVSLATNGTNHQKRDTLLQTTRPACGRAAATSCIHHES